MIRSTRLAIG